MRDLKNNLGVVKSITPAVLAATTIGDALDLLGFNSAVLVVSTGAITGAGDFTAKLQESDTTTSGDFTDVAAANLHGSFPTSLAADSLVSVGYAGFKRYVRAVITKNAGTSIAASAVLAKGDAVVLPVA
ncbi:hypothetical protein K9U40_09405 [Xanthobacter autotrophicus]|uniref:hypothetical protein n=1 Tax=Xanthobacter TaxID=279 RepID=UPI0024AB164C|nr:hypothetical protein [Xanthobacter autotrophicus]MDI4664540.1 hypothetical protein [Xanthobacter autotrophicus]